jgi:hypothetical protein
MQSTGSGDCTVETYHSFASFGFDVSNARPRVLVGIEIEVSSLLDLCDASIREQLDVSLTDITASWWPVQESGREALSQAIGRAAYLTGFERVRLPSARRPEGINLNVFPVKLQPGSRMEVISEEDLAQYLR